MSPQVRPGRAGCGRPRSALSDRDGARSDVGSAQGCVDEGGSVVTDHLARGRTGDGDVVEVVEVFGSAATAGASTGDDFEARVGSAAVLGVDGNDDLAGHDVPCVQGGAAFLDQGNGGQVFRARWVQAIGALHCQSRGSGVGGLRFEVDDQARGVAC